MKLIKLTLLFALVFSLPLFSQGRKNTFPVMFYNVENLFDTIDQPDFNDEEFTPGSEKNWNTIRYTKKLTDISRVILSLPDKEVPAIIGFAEVENIQVLNDLRLQKGLKRYGYKAILMEGNDPRGIDCGLLYREDLFKYDSHDLLPVEDLSGEDYPLRGILHISGKGPDGNLLHIYINHWKSRLGGVKETENLRVYSAIALRREMDRLLAAESDPRVIIMGDFNDEPTNLSLLDVLHAGNKRKNIWLNDLYNLFYDAHNETEQGSISYRGNWQMFDQIIISYSLVNQVNGLSTDFEGGNVLNEEWMTYKDKNYDQNVPNRTYGGNNYYGGISDHFPVYVTFKY